MRKVDVLRVLLVDADPDRKRRISLLKENGLTVYPALDLRQARERCKPGSYDLIIVNARGNPYPALELCDDILSKDHEQLLLLMTAPEVQLPHRDYLVSSVPEELVNRANGLLASQHRPVAKSLVA